LLLFSVGKLPQNVCSDVCEGANCYDEAKRGGKNTTNKVC
jgi:hypothetical protein